MSLRKDCLMIMHKLNDKLKNLISIWNFVSIIVSSMLSPIFKKERTRTERRKWPRMHPRKINLNELNQWI